MKKEVTVRWFDAGHGSLSAEEQIAETRETIAFLRRVAATTGKNARIGKEESVLSGSFVVRFSQ